MTDSGFDPVDIPFPADILVPVDTPDPADRPDLADIPDCSGAADIAETAAAVPAGRYRKAENTQTLGRIHLIHSKNSLRDSDRMRCSMARAADDRETSTAVKVAHVVAAAVAVAADILVLWAVLLEHTWGTGMAALILGIR